MAVYDGNHFSMNRALQALRSFKPAVRKTSLFQLSRTPLPLFCNAYKPSIFRSFVSFPTRRSHQEVPSDVPPTGIPLGEPLMAFRYVCMVCEIPNTGTFTKVSYERGSIFSRCRGCQKVHILADRENRFAFGSFDIESLLLEEGRPAKRLHSMEELIAMDPSIAEEINVAIDRHAEMKHKSHTTPPLNAKHSIDTIASPSKFTTAMPSIHTANPASTSDSGFPFDPETIQAFLRHMEQEEAQSKEHETTSPQPHSTPSAKSVPSNREQT